MCVNKLILSFEKGCKTLSVTCGDSSPKGRAKGLAPLYIVCWYEKWSVSVLIRSIDCFMNTHLRGGFFSVTTNQKLSPFTGKVSRR